MKNVQFIHVAIGQGFYCPDSGDEFVKTGEHTARFLGGGDYFDGQEDMFGLTEIVSIDSDS